MTTKIRLSTDRIHWDKTKHGWTAVIRTVSGVRRIPTNTHNKEEAELVARKWKKLLKLGTRFDRKMMAALLGVKHISVPAAIEEWVASRQRNGTAQDSTLGRYQMILNRFTRDAGLLKDTPASINEEMISAWVNHEKAGKAGYRQLKLIVLKAWLTWCESKGYVFGNPARAVGRINLKKLHHEQIEVKHKRALTPQEIDALMKHIRHEIRVEQVVIDKIERTEGRNPLGYNSRERIGKLKFWQAAIQIALHTGLRLGDIASLEWASLNETLVKHTRKTDKRVEIPLSDELREVIAGLEKKDERYVFPLQQKWNSDLSKNSYLSKDFKRLCKAAGIDAGLSFHCLRATHACNLKASGASIEQVAQRLAHSSTATTEVYLTAPAVSPEAPARPAPSGAGMGTA